MLTGQIGCRFVSKINILKKARELERTVIYNADPSISHYFKSLRINFTQSKFLDSVAVSVAPDPCELVRFSFV